MLVVSDIAADIAPDAEPSVSSIHTMPEDEESRVDADQPSDPDEPYVADDSVDASSPVPRDARLVELAEFTEFDDGVVPGDESADFIRISIPEPGSGDDAAAGRGESSSDSPAVVTISTSPPPPTVDEPGEVGTAPAAPRDDTPDIGSVIPGELGFTFSSDADGVGPEHSGSADGAATGAADGDGRDSGKSAGSDSDDDVEGRARRRDQALASLRDIDDEPDADSRPLITGGPRWYRQKIRQYGPLGGLVAMAAFGLIGWLSLLIGTGRISGAIGLVFGATAAPGLLLFGAPFGASSSYPLAILLSVPIWLALGWLAGRRTARRAAPVWTDFVVNLAWLGVAVLVGVVLALMLASMNLGQSIIG